MPMSKKILITGATGQIGTGLTAELRKKHGKDNVIAGGHKRIPDNDFLNAGPFETIDVTKKETIEKVVKKYDIEIIYHLAAVLSATGEKNPNLAWDVNINGLYNILEIGRENKLKRIFCPSSIAVFGEGAPKENTPQDTILKPKTMYGITKVAGEQLCDYYFRKYNLDVRGLRYPGIISSETLPGGGITDYAVEIFYMAIKNKKYTCFLREDTTLPMMYMPDCLKATLYLMSAELSKLKHHSDFNITAMSFSPKELADEIKKYIPEFKCEYKPDFRQQIASSWPKSIDDSYARKEWGWSPSYDLQRMTKDMIEKLCKKWKEGKI